MDILKFINSQSVAQYLKDVGYAFSPQEAAFIVYHSRKPLKSKVKAWTEIIDTMPDMQIPAHPFYCARGELSLRGFLARYIELEQQRINRFYQQDTDAVYSYQLL